MNVFTFPSPIRTPTGGIQEFKVRTETIDGEPWFVAADVCRALGLCLDKRTGSALFTPSRFSTLRDDEVRLHPVQTNLVDGRKQTRLMWVVAEPGLYKMILRSDKATAEPFRDWVTREVLPAIRKTGGYMLKGADRQAIQESDKASMSIPTDFAQSLRQHAATLVKLAPDQVRRIPRSDLGLPGGRPTPAGCWKWTPAGGSISTCVVSLRGERKTQKLILGIRGNPNVTLLSKKGIVRLIMRSDKPIAQPFQDWAIDVVVEVMETGKREERRQ